MSVKDRDVLTELDSVRDYLLAKIGDEPLPGQDANAKRLDGEFTAFRSVAENIVELAAEYEAGVTHKDRVLKSMGVVAPDAAAQARIADLERQLAEAKAGDITNG